jgi:hypothetical protein
MRRVKRQPLNHQEMERPMASTPNDTAGTPGTPAAAATVNPTASAPPVPREIRVYAHSMLFYWWPVWLAGYIFGLWTYFEGHRLLIVPAAKSSKLERKVDEGPDGKSVGTITYTMTIDSKKDTASLRQAPRPRKTQLTPSRSSAHA